MLEQHTLYAKEKLSRAIEIMATDPGDIRHRLRAAAGEVMLIPQAGLPAYEKVDEDIRWIQEQLARREPRFEGQARISATLHGMRTKRGIKIAERIVTAGAKLDVYVQAHFINARNGA